ncbi:hypothetical protein Dip518_000417 [Parelusimicrobium proximum]|uniref:hypothetical protein n=1 Tax=Parelusimicrobium proximum TaxID=3228953 RepID=UPI003D16AD52
MKNIRSIIKRTLNKKGQQTVEFMLMMGFLASAIIALMTIFHKDIAGIFFFFIGGILG